MTTKSKLLWLGVLAMVAAGCGAGMILGYGQEVLTAVSAGGLWYGLWHLLNFVSHKLSRRAMKSSSRRDDLLVPLISKLLKALFVLAAVLGALAYFGVNITAALAGIGIGGLALALAAKSLLANYLGTITLIMEDDFNLGDHIEVGKFQGVVKEIGLRSTTLMEGDGALNVVPNALFSKEAVRNNSKRSSRPIQVNVVIPYGVDGHKAHAVISEATDLLTSLAKTGSIEVNGIRGHLVGADDNGWKAQWQAFHNKITSVDDYRTARQKVIRRILDAGQEHQVVYGPDADLLLSVARP